MTTSAKAVRFDDDSMWVHLDDGRVLAVPLAWFPRLLGATPEQRAPFEISPCGSTGKRWTKTSRSTACWPVMAI